MEEINSFIHKNDFHGYPWLESMYNKVIELKPTSIKEIGTGSGSTTITFAKALYDLGGGILNTQDGQPSIVFQKNMDLIRDNFKHLYDIINFNYGKSFYIGEDTFVDDFDLLYIDVDNTGYRIESILKHMNKEKIYNKHILFEGGSNERDAVPQMHHKNDDGHPHWVLNRTCDCKFNKDTLSNSIVRLKEIINYEVLDETFSSVSYFYASEDIIKKFN